MRTAAHRTIGNPARNINCSSPSVLQVLQVLRVLQVATCSTDPTNQQNPKNPKHRRVYGLRRSVLYCSSSSSDRGQSSLSRRESARSASSLPPVWHVGQ